MANDKNMLSDARQYLHETLGTEEELHNEKAFPDRIKEDIDNAIPQDAQEAGSGIGHAIDVAAEVTAEIPIRTIETAHEIKLNIQNRVLEMRDNMPANYQEAGERTGESIDSTVDSIKEKIPENAEDFFTTIGEKIDAAVDDFREKYNERLEEREHEGTDNDNDKQDVGIIESARQAMFDATKPKEVKDTEAFLEKPMEERLEEFEKIKTGPCHPAALL